MTVIKNRCIGSYFGIFFLFILFLFLESCGTKYANKIEYINGFAVVKQNGKHGFIDESGKEIVAPKYDELGNFIDNLAKFKSNQKFGMVDKSGKEVIPAKYDKIHTFNGEFAKVEIQGKIGMIDKNGIEVVEPKYDAVSYNIIGKFFEVASNGLVERIEHKVNL